jgi:hypothetical protein
LTHLAWEWEGNDVIVPPEEGNSEIGILGMGATDDKDVCIVQTFSLQFFHSQLLEHFDILYRQNKIKWPSRNGQLK